MTSNAPATVTAQLQYWAEERPDRICVGMDDTTWTFAEMASTAERVAAGFAAIGIQPGDRVATLAPNCEALVELFYGLPRAGAVQVPLNAYLKGAFLKHQMADSRTKAIVVDASGAEAIKPLLADLPELETIIHLDPFEKSTDRVELSYADVLSGGSTPPEVELTPDSVVAIVYTSGTTGLPKGCVLTHGYYVRCGTLNSEALELREDDVLFAALPLFHAGACLIVLMGGLSMGITARNESAFSASRFLSRSKATNSTIGIAVGPMAAALLATPPSDSDTDHTIRTMMTAPLAPAGQQVVRERFNIEPWTEVYGQTECIPIGLTPISSDKRDATSCGLPAPDLIVKLLGEDGNEVPDGEIGEICIRPKDNPNSMFQGYWDKDTMAPKPLADGWHHTGDGAIKLPNGALRFSDRVKDSMRRRGENVSSIELEVGLMGFEPLAEVAVHAVPSPLGEDDIKACIVLKEGRELVAEEFFEYAKKNLPYFAIPRYIEAVPSLPRNPIGRVMKHLLRAEPHTENTIDLEKLGLVVGRDERR